MVLRYKMDDLFFLKVFYKEMKGLDLLEEKECLFIDVL